MGSIVSGIEPQMIRTSSLRAMDAPRVLMITVTFQGELRKGQ